MIDGRQVGVDFGKRLSCLPPAQVPKRWPLGVDRLKELWQSNSEGPLLEILCCLTNNYEPRDKLSQFMLFGTSRLPYFAPKERGVRLVGKL